MAELQGFIYVLRPARPEMVSEGPTPYERETIGVHFGYLKDLTDSGTVLHAGRTQAMAEDTFGIVVFRAESEKAACDIMNADPAVQKRVMTARLYRYRIALVGKEWQEA